MTDSQPIVETVHEYNIDYNNVCIFNSDNVSNMKAFNTTILSLFTLH